MLRNPKTIAEIVKTIVENTNVPVTVKIRTGWDTSCLNYLEVADLVFNAGASALCMHARTRSQLYMPTAHWEYLKDLKAHFPEKVIIGSGDLFTAEDGVRMLGETGVDAISYARGAIGNPFIFEQTKSLLCGETPRVIPTEEKVKAIMIHLEGLVAFLGENTACREMRKHVCAYLKGVPNSARVRQEVTSALTVQAYRKALEKLEH